MVKTLFFTENLCILIAIVEFNHKSIRKNKAMKDFSKVMLSFIVGALAGATAGILLAPDKGKNTRKKVKKSIDDLSKKAKDSMDDLGTKVKNSMDDLSAKTKKTFSKEEDVKESKKA